MKSRSPKLLSSLGGLFLIGVLAGGGYLGWNLYTRCHGNSLGMCLWILINPFPEAYSRGAGQILGCKSGQEQQAGLCYETCKDGYEGIGPYCWMKCPSGYRDDGAYCGKPSPITYNVAAQTYALGWEGFPGAIKACEKDRGAGMCEAWGLAVYPKCAGGYHRVGCCDCWLDCPAGTRDDGVTCHKEDFYGRGAGTPLSTCTGDLQQDGLLCYPKCKPGFQGIGPVCWEE